MKTKECFHLLDIWILKIIQIWKHFPNKIKSRPGSIKKFNFKQTYSPVKKIYVSKICGYSCRLTSFKVFYYIIAAKMHIFRLHFPHSYTDFSLELKESQYTHWKDTAKIFSNKGKQKIIPKCKKRNKHTDENIYKLLKISITKCHK